MFPRVTESSRPFLLEATRDGLHIDGTLLWLDAKQGKELSFLSRCPPQLKKITSKILATEETIHLLRLFQTEVDALSCQYHRPFSIGSLSLELLPTGASFGSAALLLRQKNSSILYLPELGFLPPASLLDFPPVSQVIVGAFCANPKSTQAHFEAEWDRLLLQISRSIEGGSLPFIVTPFLDFPQRLLSVPALQSTPMHLHPLLARAERVYEKFGISKSIYQAPPLESAMMISPFLPSRKQTDLFNRPLLTIVRDDHRAKWTDSPGQSIFHFSFFCQKIYRQLFKQTNPEQIYFVGPYALRYAKEIRKCAPQVQPLYAEKQPSLF